MIHNPATDLDLYSSEAILDPYPLYQELRDLGPAVWMNQYGAWVAPRYEAARGVLADADTFSSAEGVALNDVCNTASKGTTLASDRPEHDILRNVVAHALTPRALAGRRAAISELADQLVAKLVDQGAFDAVTDLAQRLPLSIVPDFIGLPEAGRDRMLAWASATFNAIGPANELAMQSFPIFREMAEYAVERVAKQDLAPGSLGAGVLQAAQEGRLPAEQCPALLIDYLAPSLDTTISAVGSAIWLLATHPEQWKLLRENPDLVAQAFNETLRLESPIRGFCRVAIRDTEIEGTAVGRGERVLVLYASANRDERKWTNAADFEVVRRNGDHLGFGLGVHSCAGQGLARLEAHAVLKSLAARAAELRIDSAERVVNNVIRAFSSLRVSVSPC